MGNKRVPRPVVIEGVVYSPAYQECDIDQDGNRSSMPVLFALDKLQGRRVRVTVEVLPDAPEGVSDDR